MLYDVIHTNAAERKKKLKQTIPYIHTLRFNACGHELNDRQSHLFRYILISYLSNMTAILKARYWDMDISYQSKFLNTD